MSDRTMRKKGRPTEAEREQRRDQILDAATTQFVSRGYGRVTFDEIAAAAKVTKRTIYAYFGDKGEVFTAVIERFRARALADVAATGDHIDDLAARLVAVLLSDEAIGMHRLMIAECPRFPDLARSFYDSGPRGYIALLAGRLEALSVSGELWRRAEQLFGLLLGEAHRRRLLGLDPAPTPSAARAHARDALAALGLGELS